MASIPLLTLAVALAALLTWTRIQSTTSLQGQWIAAFALDSAWGIDPPTSRRVSGSITFRSIPATPPGAVSVRPVHAGQSKIDFRPFGFALGKDEALGWFTVADSVRIILDPTVDHGHLELVGVRREARVDGTWRLVGNPGGARGSVVLERRAP